MKRNILIIIALVVALAAVSAQTTSYTFSSVMPKDARSMGMGGAFRVFSEGYGSFYGNPAGFTGSNRSLTVADISTWAYLAPTTGNLGRAQQIISGSASTSDEMNWIGDWIVNNNGFGAGAAIGGGWVGKKGLAIGVTLVTDDVVSGSSLLSSKLISATQANGIIGLAYPLTLGPVWFKIGVDGRVFYRMQSDPTTGWPFSDILNGTIVNNDLDTSTIDFLGGYGFAADAGLVFGIGPVMLGFSARDLGLEFNVGSFTLKDIIDSGLSALSFAGTDTATLTPTYSAGLGMKLFEDGKFEPSIYTELDDLTALVSSSDILADAFNSLHAGAQLRMFKFLTVRGGLNKGWYSLGAGIDLALIELDAAVFTEELGTYAGDRGRSGISVQAAIRFGR